MSYKVYKKFPLNLLKYHSRIRVNEYYLRATSVYLKLKKITIFYLFTVEKSEKCMFYPYIYAKKNKSLGLGLDFKTFWIFVFEYFE